MSVTFPPDLAQFREDLRAIEANRRDPQRRGLFWHAGDWQWTFDAIIGLEQSGDTEFQQRIDDARAARKLDKVLALQQQHYYTIEEHIRWYKARKTELRVLHEGWEADQMVEATAVDELVSHYDQIVYRLRERQVRLQQTAIEILEERRSRQERINIETWSRCWNQLRAAFRAQDAAYIRVFGQQIPRSIYDERLQWCYAIRACQRATARAVWKSRNLDREGLNAATALVDKLIDELRPARGHWFDISAQAKLVLVAVVIGAFLFLVLNNGGADGREVGPPTVQSGGEASGPGPLPADPTALTDRANVLLRQGQCHKAVPLFRQAAAAAPSWHRPLNDMAFCLYELGLPDEAITKWRAAINLNSEGQDAYAGLGMALYKAGRYDEALATYRRAIELGGNYLDEAWMRQKRNWSDKAITDSRPLRVALEQ